ncbi:MAG: DUF924 family protein [Pseudomonadota bacterium]|nr:DUF924 family protein [Pseudomonadota bacterium]
MFEWKHVLDFWFGELDSDGLPDEEHRNRWFRSTRKFDQEIRRRFLSLVLFASEDGLEVWREEAAGALAEVILLDQFTRNIYRGTNMAFDNDRLARKRTRQAMGRGQDMSLPPVQRAFLYMPLEHSERIEDQALAVECYEQLAASTQDRVAELMTGFLNSAKDHYAIIERFGRFPHRNRVLKRASTQAEKDWLNKGQTFGQ